MSFYNPTDWNKKILDHLILTACRGHFGNSVTQIRKFATSGVLTANIEEDIWDEGGVLSYLTNAETMSVASTSINDTNSSGTGARKILINGLDNDYNLSSEVLNLNGTTPVITANSYLRLYRVRVIDAGSGEKNEGKITLTSTSSATIQASITATRSITRMSHFTIPNGYTGISVNLNLNVYRSSGSGTRAAEFDIHARIPSPYGGGNFIKYETNQYGLNSAGTGISTFQDRALATIPSKTDYKITVTAESNNTKASCRYSLLILENTFFNNLSTI